jgi:hypothetical protein
MPRTRALKLRASIVSALNPPVLLPHPYPPAVELTAEEIKSGMVYCLWCFCTYQWTKKAKCPACGHLGTTTTHPKHFRSVWIEQFLR